MILRQLLLRKNLIAVGLDGRDARAGRGLDALLELADDVGQQIGRDRELAGRGIVQFIGGVADVRREIGGEERGVGRGGIGGERPIGGVLAREGGGIEIEEAAGIRLQAEILPRKHHGMLAELLRERGIGEEPLAGIRDLRRCSCGEEDGLATILHERGEIGRRERDGFAAGEKLGELRREPVIVEGAGAAGLHEHIGEGEEEREPLLGDEAEVEHVLLHIAGQALEKAGRIETGADKARGLTALVEERDGEVQLAHLWLVGEGVAAGEDEDLLVVAQAQLRTIGGQRGAIGWRGAVEIEIDAGEKQVRRGIGRGKLGEFVDDVRHAIGDAQEALAAQRVRQAVVELLIELGRRDLAQFGERLAGVALEKEVLVILEVDQEAGGVLGDAVSERGALVGDRELADALAGRPGMDQVGGLAVGENSGALEQLLVRGGDEQRVRDVLQRLLAVGDRDNTGMTGGAERISEAADVVEAVGGEVAVVDEEDVQGDGKMN